MPNDLIVSTSQNKPKSSFWDKPEGTTGMIVSGGIGLGILYGAYKVMPYLASFLSDTLHVVLSLIALFVILWVTVFDGTLRNLLWLRYKLLMRALTYSVITYDPFGVLRETQEAAKQRIKDITACLIKVKGSVADIGNTIADLMEESNTIKRNVDALTRKGATKEQIDNQRIRYAQTDEALKKLQRAYDLTNGWAGKLSHAKDALETINDNIAFKIRLDEKVYKAVNASHTAWKLFSAAFKGDSAMDSLQADTLAFLAEDYNQKIGEIDGYMNESQKFIDGFDLQQAVYTDEGMQLLNDLNSRDLSNITTKQLVAA